MDLWVPALVQHLPCSLLTRLCALPAYIISVNSNIIADSGGPCGIDDYTGPDKSFKARFTDQGYADCVRFVLSRGDLLNFFLLYVVVLTTGSPAEQLTAPD